MIQENNIPKLISLYLSGDLTDNEKKILKAWILEAPKNREMFEHILYSTKFNLKYELYKSIGWRKQYEKSRILRKNKYKLRRRILRYAAVFFLPLLMGVVYQFFGDKQVTLETHEVIKSKILLTLDDGRTIDLFVSADSIPEYISIDEINSNLVYEDSMEEIVRYNTLKVARGGEYKLKLSDGTYIHLNSCSELRYPVSFQRDCREVYLSGEAWFEVTHDPESPFIVMTDEMFVKVYGTSFNVNTLKEGTVETVLVEGQIGVNYNDSVEIIIKPNELAFYDIINREMKVVSVDVVPYTAWKDGMFVFSGERLEMIMNTLANWYDIDILFTEEYLKDIRFTGFLERYESIDMILDAIEKTVSVKFHHDNERITIDK